MTRDELDQALCRRRSLVAMTGNLGRQVRDGKIDVEVARTRRTAALAELDAITEVLVGSGQYQPLRVRKRGERHQVPKWAREALP